MISKKGELVKLKCTSCEETKEPECFHFVCTECVKKRSREAYERKKSIPGYAERKAEYERGRPKRKKTKRKIESIKKWMEAHPEAQSAWGAVCYAVKTGKIIKPKICGRCKMERKIIAHHKDYHHPFSIEWLCSPCHAKLRNQKKEKRQ